jgi:hypothetical protein
MKFKYYVHHTPLNDHNAFLQMSQLNELPLCGSNFSIALREMRSKNRNILHIFKIFWISLGYWNNITDSKHCYFYVKLFSLTLSIV